MNLLNRIFQSKIKGRSSFLCICLVLFLLVMGGGALIGKSILEYKQQKKYRQSLLEKQRKDSLMAIVEAERQRAIKEEGKLYCPSDPTPMEIKERTIRDLLYFPYGCLSGMIDEWNEARKALIDNFGGYEMINGIHPGLRKGKKYNYTYKNFPIEISNIDYTDDRHWYYFYFYTRTEAENFYKQLKEDVLKAGIPIEYDEIFGGHSNRTHPISIFKWVYISPTYKIKEADSIHNSTAIGLYCVEFGVYKRKNRK